jgi:hypothetical protein
MSIEMEEYAKNMGLTALARRCEREINAAARGEGYNELYWREVLYRAAVQRDEAARGALMNHLRRLIQGWISSHPKKELAYRWEREEYYVTRACEQFWQAVVEQEPALDRLSTALQYLRASLNAAILESLRVHAHVELIPSLASTEAEDSGEKAYAEAQVYWQSISKLLADEREQRIAYLLFSCGLQPGDIIRAYPHEFNSLQEISRLRNTIMKQLLADASPSNR